MTDLGTGLLGTAPLAAGGVASWSLLLSVAALALYALLTSRPENDDDDSSPGGGLMQPVA
jgi:hypothetical protein